MKASATEAESDAITRPRAKVSKPGGGSAHNFSERASRIESVSAKGLWPCLPFFDR